MSTEPTNRPLKMLRLPALTEYFERNSEAPAELLALFDELAYRSRTKARVLRARALERLRQMHPQQRRFAGPRLLYRAARAFHRSVLSGRAEGVLKLVGYRVGATDITELVRRDILDLAFSGRLPNLQDAKYARELGKPSSGARLKKLANIIASLTRNAKRNNPTAMRLAVRDWERDLEYLRISYYRGRFDGPRARFVWPRTE